MKNKMKTEWGVCLVIPKGHALVRGTGADRGAREVVGKGFVMSSVHCQAEFAQSLSLQVL